MNFQLDFHNFLPRYLEPAFAEQASNVYLPDLKMTDLEAGESTVFAVLHPKDKHKLLQMGYCHLVGRQGKTLQGELAMEKDWAGPKGLGRIRHLRVKPTHSLISAPDYS